MKQAALFLSLLLFSVFQSKAQTFSITDSEFDEFYIDLTLSNFLPRDKDFALLNRGINTSVLFNLVEFKNRVGLAPGVGISNYNLYFSKEFLEPFKQGGTRALKFSYTYVDVPLEIRFKSKDSPKSFKFTLGGKFSYLISQKAKETRVEDLTLKIKKRNTDPFQYGVFMRIGYSWINFYSFYSISQLTEDYEGNLVAIGISIGGL